MDFEHAYLYSTKGRLMSAAIARADGTVNVLGGSARTMRRNALAGAEAVRSGTLRAAS